MKCRLFAATFLMASALASAQNTSHFLYAATSPTRPPGFISGFAIDPAQGTLTPLAGSPFAINSSPIAATVDPAQRFLFVGENTQVDVFAIDPASGALTPAPGSPFTGYAFAMAVDSSGRFLYTLAPGEWPDSPLMRT